MSTKYEGDFAESLARLESEIKIRRDWLGVNWVDENSGSDRTVKVLDYACGPGTVSRVSAHLQALYTAILTMDRHYWVSQPNTWA